jgi:Ala-tRNA(Pro) deacylase
MSVRDYLQCHRVPFRAFLHRPMPTSSRRAKSAQVPGQHLAKGVLVHAGEGYVLAVLAATSRVDLARLSEVLSGVPVRLATEDEVGTVFDDCERGALPPFGRLYGLRTIVDPSLQGGSEIVCVGNTRHEGFRLRLTDYLAVEAPCRARFARKESPRNPRPSSRRAG